MRPGRHSLLHLLLRTLCSLGGGSLLAAWDGPAQAEWSAVAEQKTSYTTDAFQFSSARRLRLTEDPSQPTVVSAEKPEDVIWEPALEVDGWAPDLRRSEDRVTAAMLVRF